MGGFMSAVRSLDLMVSEDKAIPQHEREPQRGHLEEKLAAGAPSETKSRTFFSYRRIVCVDSSNLWSSFLPALRPPAPSVLTGTNQPRRNLSQSDCSPDITGVCSDASIHVFCFASPCSSVHPGDNLTQRIDQHYLYLYY